MFTGLRSLWEHKRRKYGEILAKSTVFEDARAKSDRLLDDIKISHPICEQSKRFARSRKHRQFVDHRKAINEDKPIEENLFFGRCTPSESLNLKVPLEQGDIIDDSLIRGMRMAHPLPNLQCRIVFRDVAAHIVWRQ